MPSLDTTNIILTVMAVTSATQLLLLLAGALWVGRQLATLKQGLARLESSHLAGLSERAHAVMADLHHIAERTERVGQEVERAARIAQGILHMAGYEVDRATRGVRVALDLVEGGFHQASAFGAGIRAGVKELLLNRRSRYERRVDEDAVARFDAGA